MAPSPSRPAAWTRNRSSCGIRTRYTALVPLLAVAACTDNLVESGREPSQLELDSDNVLATEGEMIEIGVTVLDQDGEPYKQLPHFGAPHWVITDEGVAQQDGPLIAALGPGETEAQVELAGLRAPATLRVNPTELVMEVDGAYLTQASQPYNGSVPLAEGRDAYMRVFLQGDVVSFFNPDVNIHVYRDGERRETITIDGAEDVIPTAVDEGRLEGSWNVRVPAEFIRPGFEFVVEADPGGAVPAASGSVTSFPEDGEPRAVEVREIPRFEGRLVPIHEPVTNHTGNVTPGNVDRYLELFLRVFPIVDHDVDVRSVYTADARANSVQGWIDLLGEIEMLRTADGSDRYYYGVVKRDDTIDIAGIGYVGWPAAVGWDELSTLDGDFTTLASGTYAHELGHNFGRLHAPCGAADGVDPDYPYGDGSIGVFGFDMTEEVPRDSQVADLMSYCWPRWTSDYTYQGVMEFREEWAAGGVDEIDEESAEALPEPTLLVWGKLRDGELVLEPAFELETRPRLPEPGPNLLEGLDDTGATLFRIPFATLEIADAGSDAGNFVFALPSHMVEADRLAELRVTAEGRTASLRSTGPRVMATQRAQAAAIAADRSAAGGVSLSWDPAAHPAALVRDPRTGEIIGFTRGGTATLQTDAPELELNLSDGVRSVTRRVQVGGP